VQPGQFLDSQDVNTVLGVPGSVQQAYESTATNHPDIQNRGSVALAEIGLETLETISPSSLYACVTPSFNVQLILLSIRQIHYDTPGVSQSEYPGTFFDFFEKKLEKQETHINTLFFDRIFEEMSKYGSEKMQMISQRYSLLTQQGWR
jgi:hypothetical protein